MVPLYHINKDNKGNNKDILLTTAKGVCFSIASFHTCASAVFVSTDQLPYIFPAGLGPILDITDGCIRFSAICHRGSHSSSAGNPRLEDCSNVSVSLGLHVQWQIFYSLLIDTTSGSPSLLSSL